MVKSEMKGKPMKERNALNPRNSSMVYDLVKKVNCRPLLTLNRVKFHELSPSTRLLAVLHTWLHDRIEVMQRYFEWWSKEFPDDTSSSRHVELSLARLLFFAVMSEVSSFKQLVSMLNGDFGAKVPRQLSSNEFQQWYHLVLWHLFLGDYKWYEHRYNESREHYVKAMEYLPLSKKGDERRVMTVPPAELRLVNESPDVLEQWELAEKELVEFLLGYLYLRLGMITPVLEDMSLENGLAFLQQARDIFQQLGHQTLTVRTLLEQSSLHVDHDHLQQSLQCLEEASHYLSIVMQSLSLTGITPQLRHLYVRMLLMKAQILLRQGHLQQSLDNANEALTFIRKYSDQWDLEWRILLLLAAIKSRQESLNLVHEIIENAWEITKKMKIPEAQLRCLANLMLLSIYRSDHRRANLYLEEMNRLLSGYQEGLDPYVEGRIEWMKGYHALEILRSPTRALEHLKKALIIWEDLEAFSNEINVLLLMARAFLQLQQVDKAKFYLERVEALVKKNASEHENVENDVPSFQEKSDLSVTFPYSHVRTAIGMYLFVQAQKEVLERDVAKAAHYFTRALSFWNSESSKAYSHHYWKARTCQAFLEVLIAQNKLDETWFIADQGIVSCQLLDNRALQADFLFQKGRIVLLDVERKLQDGPNQETINEMWPLVEEGIRNLESARKLYREIEDVVSYRFTSELLARMHEVLGRPEMAIRYLEESWEAFQEESVMQAVSGVEVKNDEDSRSTIIPRYF